MRILSAILISLLVPIGVATGGCTKPQFAGARLHTAGKSPAFAAMADFNADDNLDAAVVNSQSNSVSIFLD